MTVAPSRTTSRAAQAARTRQRLIDAAVQLFSANNYDDVAVADIAREAKVAHGLLFHYFGSKSQIYLEAINTAAEEITRSFTVREGLSPGQQLREALIKHFRYLASHRGLALRLALAGPGAGQSAWEIFESTRLHAVQWIADILDLPPPSPAMQMMWRACVGAIDEAALFWLRHGEPFEVEDIVESVVDIMATAMRAAARLDPTLDVEPAVEKMLHP